jgi:hypothetical protein
VELQPADQRERTDEAHAPREQELAPAPPIYQQHRRHRARAVHDRTRACVEQRPPDVEARAREVLREEVQDRVDAVELREQLARNSHGRAPRVLREELRPGRGAHGVFEEDRGLDGAVREDGRGVRGVAARVQVRERLQTLAFEAVLDEPARRFREEERPCDEDDRQRGLHDVRPAPGDLMRHGEEKAVAHPCG